MSSTTLWTPSFGTEIFPSGPAPGGEKEKRKIFKKTVDNRGEIRYTIPCPVRGGRDGGIAQLARAYGSYP